jgi:predicted permease
MQDILLNLSPIFGFFLIGILLRRTGFANPEQAGFMLKFVTFVTLPSLILVTVSQAQLTAHTVLLPLTNVLVDLACMVLMIVWFRLQTARRDTQGSMLISVMVTNNVFMFPFILAIYGESGFTTAVLFDFGNALLTNTLTFAIAMYYGGKHGSFLSLFSRILKTTLFWAVILGVVFSAASISLPKVAVSFLSPLGKMTGPLILIVLGILFAPKLEDMKHVVPTIAIRMVFGYLIGSSLAYLFGFTGETFAVVALCSGAPIGFIVLSFSSIHKLDMQFTATAVSISVLIGLFSVPTLMYLFNV